MSRLVFDVMDFTIDGDRWLASGLPGVGMDAPTNLRLLHSADNGRRWNEVSSSGRVDVRRLVASGTVATGISAADGARTVDR